MTIPFQKNLTINQGCTFSSIIEVPEDFVEMQIPFEDCVVDCQFRESYIQSEYYTLTGDLYQESNGEWMLQLYSSAANTLLMKPKRYRYDVEISFMNEVGVLEVHRIVEGIIEVMPAYTQDI